MKQIPTVNKRWVQNGSPDHSCENCLYYHCTHIVKHNHTPDSNEITMEKDKHACNYGMGTGRQLKCFTPCENWRSEKNLDPNLAKSFERRIKRLEYYMEKVKP